MGVRRFVLAFLALLALAVAVDNMLRPLSNPDEGRYSEISREMAETGDWVTPRLNGIKYFEKPPLQYWASAAVFRLFGVSEFSARIYVALCGLLALACIYFTASRLASPSTALFSVAVLMSSPYFMALGGIVTLDTGLTAWLTVAVCAFLLAQHEATGKGGGRRWMLVAWAAMGLAVLSKGLVGIVLPAGAIFLHCLVHRDWRLLGRLEWFRGSLLFFAITAPWFVLVARENPEFLRFFFIHEHFERFLTKSHRREKPWWYFWPILFLGFLPWLLALVPTARAAWNSGRVQGEFPWRRFALTWTLLVMVFFSVSGSKLPAYILPAFPVLALLVGDWLERCPPRRLAALLPPVGVLLLAAIVAFWGIPERTQNPWTRELYFAARPWFIAGFALLLAAMAIAAGLAWRGRKSAAIAVIVAASLAFLACIEDGYEEMSERHSGKWIAAKVKLRLTPDTRIYSVSYYDQTLPFYLERTMTLVQYVDEFATGLRAQPHLAIDTLEGFPAEWARPGPAMAIMQPGIRDRFAAEGLSFIPLHEDPRRVVVAKP